MSNLPTKDLNEQELEVIHEAIHTIQGLLLPMRENEPLDGDDVDAIVYEIREALNDINGNN